MIYLKRLFPFFLIATLALAAYSNTFDVPFQFDGKEYIEKNPYLKSLQSLPQIWFKDASHKARYVTYITFALNHHFGGMEVFGYHLVNLIIHILNAFLVYWLVQLIYQSPKINGGTHRDARHQAHTIALAAALIFVAHPIQTQAVTYIVQRFASLATMFYLLSVCLYAKGRQSKTHVYLILSGFSALLGMFTKQITITLPATVLLYEFLLISDIRQSRKFLTILGIVILTFFLIIPALYSFQFINLLTMTSESGSRDGEFLTTGTYLLTQFRVLMTYLRLMILPIGQNLDYDYPMSHALWEPATLASFLALVLLLAGAILVRQKDRLISFGICWFFITASVESSVIVITNVIFEHRMYLPSIGIIISFAAALAYFIKKKSIYLGLIAGIACVLAIATYQRNKIWHSDITLWEDALKKSPGKARPYKNLGIAYAEAGAFSTALKYLSQAVAMTPKDVDAVNNLANVYNRLGDKQKAISLYEDVIRLAPNHAAAHNNLGSVYYDLGDLQSALKYYALANHHNPIDGNTYYNLANTYYRLGQKQEAMRMNRLALMVAPHHAQVYQNMGILFAEENKDEEAIEHYLKAIELKPDYGQAHNNLAVVYFKRKEYKKAIEHLDAARRLGYNVNPAFLKALETYR